MRSPARGIAFVAAAAVLAFSAQAEARTKISCDFDYGSGVLQVRVPAAGPNREPTPGAALVRPDASVITVADSKGNPVGCTGSLPRTGDTRTIVVSPRRPRQPIALALDLRENAFPAGLVIDARLGRGQLGIALGSASDRVAGGALAGANALDLAYSGNVSADVVTNPAATLRLDTGEGDNVVSLAGGGRFAGPWSSQSSLAGRTGSDLLVGGAATDLIFGGDGPDTMLGMGGNDLLSAAGAGPDQLDCGAGSDIALASGPGDSVTACETKRRRLPSGVGRLRQLQQRSR